MVEALLYKLEGCRSIPDGVIVAKHTRSHVSLFISWVDKTEETLFISLEGFSFLFLAQKNAWHVSYYSEIQLIVGHKDLQT